MVESPPHAVSRTRARTGISRCIISSVDDSLTTTMKRWAIATAILSAAHILESSPMKMVFASALLATVLSSAAYAQQAPAAPATGSVAVANPHYVAIPMEITVNKPVAEVWKRVGKFCDIGEWLPQLACTIQSGKDGDFGAVRSLAG